MKSFLVACAFSLMPWQAFSNPSSPQELRPVLISVTDIFAPHGFDENDTVEIGVTGLLPGLCYQNPLAKVTSIRDGKIFIEVSAYYRPTRCLFPSQFKSYVSIERGRLAAGEHEIVVNDNTEFRMTDKIHVDALSKNTENNGTDSYLYADLGDEDVKIEENQRVTLNIKEYSPCLQFKEYEILDNGKNTFSILPKMEQSTLAPDCKSEVVIMKPVSFVIPKKLKSQMILLHIRTAGGTSINRMIHNQHKVINANPFR